MLSTVLMAAYGVAMLALFVIAVTTLAWMLDSWRTPWAVGQMPFPVPDEPQLSFSLYARLGTRSTRQAKSPGSRGRATWSARSC